MCEPQASPLALRCRLTCPQYVAHMHTQPNFKPRPCLAHARCACAHDPIRLAVGTLCRAHRAPRARAPCTAVNWGALCTAARAQEPFIEHCWERRLTAVQPTPPHGALLPCTPHPAHSACTHTRLVSRNIGQKLASGPSPGEPWCCTQQGPGPRAPHRCPGLRGFSCRWPRPSRATLAWQARRC